MKKFGLIIVGCMFAVICLMTLYMSQTYAAELNEETKIEGGVCPITQVRGDLSDCLSCHADKTFKIKEVQPFESWEMPNIYSSMTIEYGEPIGIFKIRGGIGSGDTRRMEEFFDYLYLNHSDVNKMIIDIHSGGGSLFEGYRIVGLMKYWKAQGWDITTRVHGFAASAAFFIFCGGDTRLVSPQAELMWHELSTFAMFDVSGPADKEDQAIVLRHLQNTANTMLAEMSNMTKEEIDQKIRKKEFWLRGEQAIKYGFATGIME